MHVPRFFSLVLSVLTLSPTAVRADDATFTPAASTFWLEQENIVFSINIANDSSDVYFHLSGPASSWVGIGFGSKMEDSLMVIAYPDDSGSNVTLSPRIGRHAGEPVYTPGISIDLLSGSEIKDDSMTLNARCKDCRVWPHGYLDATSPSQPMIFALGAQATRSSSLSADLRRHRVFGAFEMDLRAATGVGGVPGPKREGSGVVLESVQGDGERRGMVHALLGCLVLFVVWPVNMLVAGFVRKRCFHVVSLVVVLVCLGVVYGLGIVVSGGYNRTRAFNTPHQILALIALAPLLLLTLLPLPRISSLHRSIPRAHAPLSSLALTLLLVSGGLGLHVSQRPLPLVLIYTALSLLLIIFLAIMHAVVRRRGSANAAATVGGMHLTSVSELGLLRKESRAGSEGSGSVASLKGFLEESRRDEGRSGDAVGLGIGVEEERQIRLFGGGTMPGPQYLLNMHPGVPVHIGSGRTI